MKPLVISETALNLMTSTDFAVNEILTKDLPSFVSGVIVGRLGEAGCYLFTRNCAADCRLLVIRRWKEGLFEAVPAGERRTVFDRCVRLGLQSFDRSIVLNSRWLPYHQDSFVSIFASGIGMSQRLVAERTANGTENTYVFEYDEASKLQSLGTLLPDYTVLHRAIEEFPLVLASPVSGKAAIDGAQIDLEVFGPQPLETKGFSFEEWLPRLSVKQREFVDKKALGPIRLRGAAGTGKTLAMVLKAVRSMREADAAETPVRILFLTHSWAMAERVDDLVESLRGGDKGLSTIVIAPLMTIAHRRDYKAIGRLPLGIDSEEGKIKGLAEVRQTIAAFQKGDWAAYKGGCSENFINGLEASNNSTLRRGFEWDLLVEFGCVMAAQGFLGRSSDKDKYVKIRRPQWMMPLEYIAEKSAVFALWRSFLEQLSSKGLIITDQIVCDALNDLSTFYWEAARSRDGYDLIFVDETHLFNSQERQIFHHLLSDGDKPPLVLMALDPKQSPREVFTSLTDDRNTPTNIYDQARLPNSEMIELTAVYRYTPELAALTRMVLDAAPGLGLVEDWDLSPGESVLESGGKPEYKVVSKSLDALREAISIAKEAKPSASARGGRVAILCLDNANFNAYCQAGQIMNDTTLVSSRDDVVRLRYLRKKTILSSPEYVAGLQFDTVIILDANKNLVPDGNFQGHHVRRFLSELYLGLSRAEHRVCILASEEGGGLSPYLKRAIDEGVLVPRA